MAAGVVVPDPKSSVKLAEGLAGLLNEFTACQRKPCGTAGLVVFGYEEAPSCKADELIAAVRVAAVASRLNAPRNVLTPFT